MEKARGLHHAIVYCVIAAVAVCAALVGFSADEASADQLAPASTYGIEEIDGLPEGLETDAWPTSLEDFIKDFS